MRIPDWNPESKPQPQDLVQAVLARRGGELLQLDRALLWSEPLARGWNTYLGNVRTKFGADRRLCELGICTVALATGAEYEYTHHAPVYLQAGGTQEQLDALQAFVAGNTAARAGTPREPQHSGAAAAPAAATASTASAASEADAALGEDEALVAAYALSITRDVKVDDALFSRMKQRFATTELVEITATIAAYNMVARFLLALGITPDDEKKA